MPAHPGAGPDAPNRGRSGEGPLVTARPCIARPLAGGGRCVTRPARRDARRETTRTTSLVLMPRALASGGAPHQSPRGPSLQDGGDFHVRLSVCPGLELPAVEQRQGNALTSALDRLRASKAARFSVAGRSARPRTAAAPNVPVRSWRRQRRAFGNGHEAPARSSWLVRHALCAASRGGFDDLEPGSAAPFANTPAPHAPRSTKDVKTSRAWPARGRTSDQAQPPRRCEGPSSPQPALEAPGRRASRLGAGLHVLHHQEQAPRTRAVPW